MRATDAALSTFGRELRALANAFTTRLASNEEAA
jgi:hypothetical protein